MNASQLNDRGQLTIPKAIREKADLKPNDPVNIEVNERGQIIITKRGFFDDLEDLIRKDLVKEGVEPYDIETKMVEKKKELAQALNQMAEETEKEISRGEFTTLEEIEKELYEE
jgi:AbrB family looped-hinge helix DNA binding protein